MWRKLIEKIELQSILVLVITLSAGTILLKIDNSLSSPSGVIGSICLIAGIIYTIASFYSNQVRENYKDIISEYRTTISTLRTSNRDMQKSYRELSERRQQEKYGNFQSEGETGTDN